jgi:hypothetical protein
VTFLMGKYETYIQELIKTNTYMLGTEINTALQKKFSVNSGAARKALQRVVDSNVIKSSHPLTFGYNQYAYLLKTQHLSKEIVLKIAETHRPPLFRILVSLDLNGGIISKYEAQKIAATPIKPGITKADSLQKLIVELKEKNFVQEINHVSGVEFLLNPSLAADANEIMTKEIARMFLDTTFIPDILRALQSFNIIDNKNILYRNKNNPSLGIQHNNFYWDAIAYTRTTGINPYTASKANTTETQTLVVLDIVTSKEYSIHDLNGFLARIQSVVSGVKSGKRKVLPIVIYSDISDERTKNIIKKLGFLSFDLGSIFGSKIYSVLTNLNELKKGEHEKISTPENTVQIIEKTLQTMREAGQEENLNGIKGDLFEFLMYPLFTVLFPQANIKHGERLGIKNNSVKKEYEYDYIIDSSRQEEITIIELKGYSSSIYISLGDLEKKNSLKWFFNKTLPFAIQQLKVNTKSNYRFTGCFITTAKFNNDGVEFLNKINNGNLKPKELECWYDGSKLIELLKSKNMKKPKEIIEKYYIKDEE